MNSKSILNFKSYRHKKPVVKLDLEGNFVEEYISVHSASALNRIPNSDIFNNLSGKNKTCRGFIFKYKKDYESRGL